MANELRKLRLDGNIPMQDMVEVVRERYPKYDKPLQSKCERTKAYGVTLAPDAMELLYERFGTEPPEPAKSSRHGKHRYTNRIACRLPNGLYFALQRAIRADGYDTMQAWLTDMVKAYLRSKTKENEQTKGANEHGDCET